MESGLWMLVVTGGPILLGLVLIFVILSNRRRCSARDLQRTEDATRHLYRQLDREDKLREGELPADPPKRP